jgi:hypothetical protein
MVGRETKAWATGTERRCDYPAAEAVSAYFNDPGRVLFRAGGFCGVEELRLDAKLMNQFQ